MDPNNPATAQFAQTFVAELLQEIEGKLKYEDNFVMRTRLEDAATHFTVCIQFQNLKMNVLQSRAGLLWCFLDIFVC